MDMRVWMRGPFKLAVAVVATFCVPLRCSAQTLVIAGGTLIDVSNFGHSSHDLVDAVVVIKDGVISAVGDRTHVDIPHDVRIIDASGKFIVPGLIDGFGSLRTQGFADAYLYEGVTTIFVQQSPVGEDGEEKLIEADPGPTVIRGLMIGGYSADGTQFKDHPWTEHRLNDLRLSSAELIQRVASIAQQGARGVMVGFDVWPDQLDVIIREAHARHLVTLGELAFTSYPYGVRASVDALLRNDRYQTEIASLQDLLSYSDDPEGPGGRGAYHDVCATDENSAVLTAFGGQLKLSHTALMPILSIEATADDLDPNPWTQRSTVFVTAADLDDPVDPRTGARPYLEGQPAERRAALKSCAIHRQEIDKQLHVLGARFLAASCAPAFGIMPGGGLHQELALLEHIGLTPREALAAATSNYADVYGWSDVGRIEAGRTGDVLLLSADPRSDASAVDLIDTVIHHGKIVDRDALSKSTRKNVFTR